MNIKIKSLRSKDLDYRVTSPDPDMFYDQFYLGVWFLGYLKTILLGILTAFILLSFSAVVSAGIYRWVDENGKTHFSDKKPSSTVNSNQLSNVEFGLSESARLEILQGEIGRIVLKQVVHGQYQQYIPKGGLALSTLKIVVVNHGMFGKNENEITSARNTLDDWIAFSEKYQAIIVAPAYDNANYAVTEPGDGKGGYRGLFGRKVGADEFLHEIINEYQQANSAYDGRFYLSGHSAGAQFANRYIVRHPDRVIAAAFSAPAWFAQPTDTFEWPYGMGRRQFNSRWPGESFSRKIDVQPNQSGWLAAAQKPIMVVVGELDLDKLRHVEGIGGDTHVARAKYWVNAMNQYAVQYEKKGKVELKLISNVGHSYGKLARECQKYLEKYM